MIERRDVHHGPEAQSLRALRHRREEHRRRRRHAQRREMVLGDVVGGEARALVGLHDLQALAVEPLVRAAAEVEVVEDAEFHRGPCHFPLLFEEGCRRRRRGGNAVNIEPPRRFAPPLLVQGGENPTVPNLSCRSYRAVFRCRGIAPAASILLIDSLVNSALGASPPITNIRIEGLFFGPLVTFMKRREAPGGNEIRSSGFRSTCSSLPRSFSQLARQVPVMAMKVSLVSWLCSMGPLPGSARQ